MKWLVSLVAAAFFVWLGLVTPWATAAVRSAPAEAIRIYDHAHAIVAPTLDISEGGTNAQLGRDNDPDGLLSDGVLACPEAPTPPSVHAYDGIAHCVQAETGNRVAQDRPRDSSRAVVVGKRWCVAANGVPARFVTTGAGTTIDRLAVNTTVSAQRQGRHVLGAREYGGGSYFNSADDAQDVLDAFHSGGAQVLGTKGKDIVRVPGITGFNHNPGAGFPHQATNVFFIKGSSSPSVVPYNPAWKP